MDKIVRVGLLQKGTGRISGGRIDTAGKPLSFEDHRRAPCRSDTEGEQTRMS